MIQRTGIAKGLRDAGNKVQYDEHVKRVLSSRQVLARILKGTAEEYRAYSVEEIQKWIEPDARIDKGLHDLHEKKEQESFAADAWENGESGNGDMITGDRNESRVPGAGMIAYDVRFRAYVPGEGETCTIKLLVNVEAQRLFYQKYRIVTRGIFYGARMLSEQLDREFTDKKDIFSYERGVWG